MKAARSATGRVAWSDDLFTSVNRPESDREHCRGREETTPYTAQRHLSETAKRRVS